MFLLGAFLDAEQVIVIVSMFPQFDYLRVIVASALFGCIFDVENLDSLLNQFTEVSKDSTSASIEMQIRPKGFNDIGIWM